MIGNLKARICMKMCKKITCPGELETVAIPRLEVKDIETKAMYDFVLKTTKNWPCESPI
jgi:hypothetical protein